MYEKHDNFVQNSLDKQLQLLLQQLLLPSLLLPSRPRAAGAPPKKFEQI